MQRTKPVAAARICQLFDDHLLPSNVVIVHPAQALFWPDHQKALLSGFFEDLPVNNAQLTEPLHVWHDLLRQKPPIGFPEHDLLFRKLPGEHTALLHVFVR